MIRTSLVALAALVPALASPQANVEAARGAARAADEGNARVERAADAQLEQGEGKPAAPAAPAEGAATAADQGLGSVPPPDTYTVRPGDTLWDLSGRFLNNPWYWPKVWSYNPEITNPHWIYPGNVLRFYPSAEEAPTRVGPVEPGQVAEAVPEEEPTDLTAPQEMEDFSKADMKAPAPVEEEETVAVAGPYKIGYVPPKAVMARRDTFVTPREVEESGEIAAAFSEKTMLSTLDKAYAHFRDRADLAPGETYVVYRTERSIHHPITGELVGYQSRILGTAKVVGIDDRAVSLIIGQTIEPIERGDLLGPWTEKLVRPVQQRPNTRDLAGTIVASQVDVVTEIGEHHVVFIDRGQSDGVEEGNVFRVVRSGDLMDLRMNQVARDSSLPEETVGDLLVIDVKETTSTALVTRSLRELYVGDRVVMRAAGAGGG
jgi:hypothetical protein